MADGHLNAARSTIELEAEIPERLKAELDELPATELSTAQRNVATSAGVRTSRARELQGDFSTPPKHERDAAEILRAVKARGRVIESTAEEVPLPELGGIVKSPPNLHLYKSEGRDASS